MFKRAVYRWLDRPAAPSPAAMVLDVITGLFFLGLIAYAVF
jgi:hypothetical protein